MICPHCGFNSPPEMRYCGKCGARLTVACAACGFANPMDFRFCGMCGMELAPASADSPKEARLTLAAVEPVVPEVETPQMVLDGERRMVTVLVTDLTDSTELLEKLGTEAWVALMNRILHILEVEVNRFGGEVSQFRGDGMVAFFGATSAHEDDPERAVLAAQAMQRALGLYVSQQAWEETLSVQMRVGINTGEVIVSRSEERQHWEETAMGIAVSVAARMEASAEPGTVLVSEDTYRLVADEFEWQNLGEISIKGVSHPITVYRPLAYLGATEIPAREQGLLDLMPRIGRAAEIHKLLRCVEGLFEGKGCIVTLTGEKGYGKSFLLHEVRRYFAHRGALYAETHPASPPSAPELTWVRGLCRSYSQNWPYAMWVDLFHDWLGIRLEGSKEEKRDRLRKRAEALLGDEVEEHYPYLATFLDLPLENVYQEKIQYLNAESLRKRFFVAVRKWIEAASRTGPLVLHFSDLQWVDESSLALLEACLSICDEETLLCLLVFRPEREAAVAEFHRRVQVEYPHRLIEVNLPPLTKEQSLELIEQLVGKDILPPETIDLIWQSAQGNPYYTAELVRSLMDQGVLAQDDGGAWQMTRDVTTLDLPTGLQQLLLGRIARLSTQERVVFQVAAVIGPVFWLNMLQVLLGEHDTVKADLTALQRAQFIQENGRIPALGMQYAFKTPLIRETAYESLLSNQCAHYHLKAAEYLENRVKPDDLAGYNGMLAYHYRGARDIQKENHYTVLAAEGARKLYANAEALQYYERAMALLDLMQAEVDSEEEMLPIRRQRFEVLNGRREVSYRIGQFESLREDTAAMLRLARQIPDEPAWLFDALLAQAEILAGNREALSEGLSLAYEALELARQAEEQRWEMRSLHTIANIRHVLKDPGWLEMAESALAMARNLNDLETEVNLLLGLGGAYGSDDLPRSREYLNAALERSVTLHDKAIELVLLEAVGQQYERDGDYYRQLTEYEQKRLQLSREIGNYVVEGKALMNCGQIQAHYLGDYEGGLALEKQALRAWEHINVKLFPMLRIAQIQTSLGSFAEAEAMLDAANPLGEQVVDYIGLAGLNVVRAMLFIALGDEEHLKQALEITSRARELVENNLVSRQYQMTAAIKAASVHLKLAKLLDQPEVEAERQDHLRHSLEAAHNALEVFNQFGFCQVVECTSEEIFFWYNQALAANSRSEEAQDYLKRAFDEMMRKRDLIPKESPFRKTYMENIQLHRDIWAAYAHQDPHQMLHLVTGMKDDD